VNGILDRVFQWQAQESNLEPGEQAYSELEGGSALEPPPPDENEQK
jgi:hypothetical protein